MEHHEQIGELLESVIIAMKMDSEGKYEPAEIADAMDVYLDIAEPETLAEAKELISEHLVYSQAIGQSLMAVGALEDEEADATGAVAKSTRQQKADQRAAKKALRAAKLEADAKKKEETRKGILSSATERAEKKRQRAMRKKAALDRRSMRLKELAAKKAALGEKRAAAGERSAVRTEKWANFRARWAARSAERLRKRAEKARVAAGTGTVAPTDAEIGHELCMEQNKTVGASLESHTAQVGATMCETCHSTTQSNLSRCAACKSVWYCSAECQAADWNHGGHPEECAAVQYNLEWADAHPVVKARHLHRIHTALTE